MINDKDAPINKFKDHIDFEEKEFTQMNNADKAQNHYEASAEIDYKLQIDSFLMLDFTIDRVDMLSESWKVHSWKVEMIMISSPIERGLSVNKEVL